MNLGTMIIRRGKVAEMKIPTLCMNTFCDSLLALKELNKYMEPPATDML